MASKRSQYIGKMEQALKGYDRDRVFYLCSVDFVDFKLINYHYGYESGDELMDAIVEYMREIPDCVCCERADADHFLFIIAEREVCSEKDLIRRCDHWGEQFVAMQRGRYPACNLAFWCGIYQMKDQVDLKIAIDNADLARKKAKEMKRASAVFFKDSMLHEILERNKREKEVMQTLAERRFTFFLQPQVDLATGEIVGAEALARGIYPDGTLMPPAVFIPVMEKNGAIMALDFLVLEQVCQNLRERLDRGEPVVRISVNLSRLHLKRVNTVDRLHKLVKSYRIPPELLQFEMTENIFLNDFSPAKAFGEALTKLGYQTSVDDFGSGYAGIDVWRNLKFDELKLDRSFLMGEEREKKRNSIIVTGLVWIATQLGISVICEGVEEAQQCRKLLDVGCHLAQGFYFSKPVPPEIFYETYCRLNGHYAADFPA